MSSSPKKNQMPYPLRSRLVQFLSPQPKRELQRRILLYKLKTGLDIGCGEASPFSALRKFGFYSVGLDIDKVMLEKAKEKNLHDEYILADIRKVDIANYDVIVMSHVIEHLDKAEATLLLLRLEKNANCIFYLETPMGFMHQDEYGNNPYQKHLSGWHYSEFQSRGYETFGIGWRLIGRKDRGFICRNEFANRLLLRLTQILVYKHPERGSFFAAMLDKKKKLQKY